MTSDITYSSLLEQCSRARQCTSKKKGRHALSRDRAHRPTCSTLSGRALANSLLKLCPRLFLFLFALSLFLLMLPSLRSIIVEHRSRRARYKCPSLSGSRNPQQLPSCLAILAAALILSLPPPTPPAPFLSFVPVQNLIPSSLKGLISPLLLVLFPRHPLKRARTAPDGSDERSRGG